MSEEQASLSGRILDMVLELAEASSWEQLRLHSVATGLQIGLDEILIHYPQKDGLAEAWFDRANRTMLVAEYGPDFSVGTVR